MASWVTFPQGIQQYFKHNARKNECKNRKIGFNYIQLDSALKVLIVALCKTKIL